MSQTSQSPNQHIEEYLDYYTNLDAAPGFAVLLKGEWGAGKTWFVKHYKELLEEKIKHAKKDKRKVLYVSLYGVSDFGEIDKLLFQQLHPILSSKGMKIAGKFLQSILKTTIRIDVDLNRDHKNDGSVSAQLLDFNISEDLKLEEGSVLIFDDLERCKIETHNLLGYINQIVEHQDYKVIIVANEEKIEDDNYKIFKEKLIGKTFNIELDFLGAFNAFVEKITQKAKDILSNEKNRNIIIRLYGDMEYRNLRILKQILYDFSLLVQNLSDQVLENDEALQRMIEILIISSIYINSKELNPKEIEKISQKAQQEIVNAEAGQAALNKMSKKQELELIEEAKKKWEPYASIYTRHWTQFSNPFPSLRWWMLFFDQGIIDQKILNNSIASSKLFKNETTPHWVKLRDYWNLTDQEYNEVLQSVQGDYENKIFTDISEIKCIVKIFLDLAKENLLDQEKQDILEEAKKYIENLKQDNPESFYSYLYLSDPIESLKWQCMEKYPKLGFFEDINFEEFGEFDQHFKSKLDQVRVQEIKNDIQQLLEIMKSDIDSFCCSIAYRDKHCFKYHEFPIFKYVDVNQFIEKVLDFGSESHGHQKHILCAFGDRYKLNKKTNKPAEELQDEFDWFKSFHDGLQQKINENPTKLSSQRLKKYCEVSITPILQQWEQANGINQG